MGGAAVAVLCAGIGGLGCLLAAAALLRLAVVLANRMVGSVKEKATPRTGIAEWDWDDWDDEDQYDKEAPSARPVDGKPAIPEPGIPKSAAIVFLTAFASALGYVFLRVMAEGAGFRPWRDDTITVLILLDLPVACLSLIVLLVMTIPTTFWRAAMVTFVYGLLGLALAGFIGALLIFMRAIV